MPVPTWETVAVGDLYVGYPSGPITSPLVLTTTDHVPASTPDAPSYIFILFRSGPWSQFTSPPPVTATGGFLTFTVTDDSGNTYTLLPDSGDGSRAYDFGSPTFLCPSGFSIGFVGINFDGGGQLFAYRGQVTSDLPSGSSITVDFTTSTPGTPQAVYLGATAFNVVGGTPPDVCLSGRTIDPTNTSAGVGAEPLGQWPFNSVINNQGLLFCHLICDDSGVDSGNGFAPGGSPVVDGSQSIFDTSGPGNWQSIPDQGGHVQTSAYGGMIYSVYVCDTSVVDLTEFMVQFDISGGIGNQPELGRPGEDAGGPFPAIAIYQTRFVAPGNVPVFNNHIRLSE